MLVSECHASQRLEAARKRNKSICEIDLFDSFDLLRCGIKQAASPPKISRQRVENFEEKWQVIPKL